MIHQYLYARRNTGYCQLGDLGGAGFSQEDLTGFQSLWKYNIAEGMNRADLPECRYFYCTDCTPGRAAIIGQTTFVPGGSSKISGDRDTTFLHKLIFTGDSFHNLMEDSGKIFAPYRFFRSVEEAGSAGNAAEPENVWNAETGNEKDGNDKTGSAEAILRHFGIESHEDRLRFFYAVFDVPTKVDLRLYLPLTDKTKEESELLLALLDRLLAALPGFFRERFGFLTYTETFHHSSVNMIPEAIQLIGIPVCKANELKLEKYSQSNYIFGYGGKYLPEFSIDPYTQEMLTAVERAVLIGEKDPGWYSFFGRVTGMLSPGGSIEPEQLSSLYMLYEMTDCISEQGSLDMGAEYIRYIIRSVFACPALCIPEIQDTAVRFLRMYLKASGIGGNTLNLMADYYIAIPDYRETCIQILCLQLENAAESKHLDHFKLILEFPYEDSGIADEVKKQIYLKEKFYPAARFYDNLQFEKLKAASESRRQLIEKIIGVLRARCKGNPAYVGDAETVRLVEKWFLALFPDAGTKEGYKDTYGDIFYLYQGAKDFAKEQTEGSQYFSVVLTLIRRLIGRTKNETLGEQDLKSLELWQNTIMKDSMLQNCAPYFLNINEQISCARYESIFRNRDGQAVLGFLESRREGEKSRIIGRLQIDWGSVLEQIEFKQEDELVRFFATIYLYRYNDRKLIAGEILYRKNQLGGFPVLKKMVDRVRLKRSLDMEDYHCIEKAVREYLSCNELDNADVRFLKSEPKFSKAIGTDPYLIERPKGINKVFGFGKKKP